MKKNMKAKMMRNIEKDFRWNITKSIQIVENLRNKEELKIKTEKNRKTKEKNSAKRRPQTASAYFVHQGNLNLTQSLRNSR